MTLTERIDAIEATYEFLLAYAAQGLETDAGSRSGPDLRHHLESARTALDGIVEAAEIASAGEPAAVEGHWKPLLGALERDAEVTRAAMSLVLSRQGISSQLVDNLNVSTHVRALLTDLFLVDELLAAGDG